ncbi:MAG: CbtA family protein [Acetobacter aceti]|nr:CbtA family protein [Acetobacter aceti]
MPGTAYGGPFSLAFTVVYGRIWIGHPSPRADTLLIAIACFIIMALPPDLKRPPNPPAVGNPETISLLTDVYFETILLSACCTVISILTARLLVKRSET